MADVSGWDVLGALSGDLRNVKVAGKVVVPAIAHAISLTTSRWWNANGHKYYAQDGQLWVTTKLEPGPLERLDIASSDRSWALFAEDAEALIKGLADNPQVKAAHEVADKLTAAAKSLA